MRYRSAKRNPPVLLTLVNPGRRPKRAKPAKAKKAGGSTMAKRRRRTAKRRYHANKTPKARKTRKSAAPAAAKKVTKAVKTAKAVTAKAEKTLDKAEKVLKAAKTVAKKVKKAKKTRKYVPRAFAHAARVGAPATKRSPTAGAFVPWAGRKQKPGRGHRAPGYHAYTSSKLRSHWRLFENRKPRRRGKRRNVSMPSRSSRTGRFLKRGLSANRKTRKTRKTRKVRRHARRNTRRTASGRFTKRHYRRNKGVKRTRRSWLARTFGWKKNQGIGAVADTALKLVKPGLAAAAGFFLARVAGNYVRRSDALSRAPFMRAVAPSAANITVALAAWYLPRKIGALSALKEYSEPMAIGAVVGLVETVLTQFGGNFIQAHVAPPTSLAGLGDSLDVYERALRGMGEGGWNDYNPSDEYLLSTLAGDDGLNEYITEPLGGLNEYIEEPLSDYIAEPGYDENTALIEGATGIDTGIYGPGVGDLGVDVEEAIAGVPIEAEEGLATHIFGGASGNGLFGLGADTMTTPKVALKAKSAALQALNMGLKPADAAKSAYQAVKSSEGVTTGSAALRAAVVAGVRQALQECGCCKKQTRNLLPRAGTRRPVAPMVTGPQKCREVCSTSPTTRPGLRLVGGAPQLTQSIGAGGAINDDLGDDLAGGGIFGGPIF